MPSNTYNFIYNYTYVGIKLWHGKEKLKTKLLDMHDYARLDMKSYIYMLRNAETQRPERQCTMHLILVTSVLSNHINGKENKGTYVCSATHQVDAEQKAYN